MRDSALEEDVIEVTSLVIVRDVHLLLGLDALGQPGVVPLEGREEHLVAPGAATWQRVQQGPDPGSPRPL